MASCTFFFFFFLLALISNYLLFLGARIITAPRIIMESVMNVFKTKKRQPIKYGHWDDDILQFAEHDCWFWVTSFVTTLERLVLCLYFFLTKIPDLPDAPFLLVLSQWTYLILKLHKPEKTNLLTKTSSTEINGDMQSQFTSEVRKSFIITTWCSDHSGSVFSIQINS